MSVTPESDVDFIRILIVDGGFVLFVLFVVLVLLPDSKEFVH
jgi:hypothetical protein